MADSFSSPFKRIYFDVPVDVHDMLVRKAKAAGMTQKAYLARLIDNDAKGGKPGKK